MLKRQGRERELLARGNAQGERIRNNAVGDLALRTWGERPRRLPPSAPGILDIRRPAPPQFIVD